MVVILGGCFISRGLQVEVIDGPVYEKDTLTKSDLKVTSISLFGIPRTVTHYSFTQSEEGIDLNYQLVKKKQKLDIVALKELKATYDGSLYQWDAPDEKNISVTAVFADGSEKEVEDFSCDLPEEVDEDSSVEVSCLYGETNLQLSPIKVDHLEATYKGSVYQGEKFKPKKVRLKLVYTDGEKKKVKDFTVEEASTVDDTKEVAVSSRYGDTICTIQAIGVNWVELDSDSGAYEEDTLSDMNMIFHYDDGEEKKISADQVSFEDDTSRELVYGENTFNFSYGGKTYSLTVDAKHTTKVIRAKRKNKEEVEKADYSHITENIYVTVTKHVTEDAYYYLSHIVINYPEQIHAGLSNDSYGGERERPSRASKRLNWVIGSNGSNFDYSTGKPTYANIKIKNSQIMDDSKDTSNGMEICLTKDGELYSPTSGTTAENLLANGVTDTFCCGDSLLVSDGKRAFDCSTMTARYPRTAIGMVEACEYYLVTAGSGNYKGGMTYQEIQDLFMDLGCTFGKCMDGGGSSSLVFENKLINTPATSEERPVVDFLYFTDIVTYG